MRRTELLQEVRLMRFEEAFNGWRSKTLSQEEAARLLGVSVRTFRRYKDRYEDGGVESLYDKRLSQASHRRAPVDEVMKLVDLYGSRYRGFGVKHFYSWYLRDHKGSRSYTWVKNKLQENGCVKKATRRGAHRRKRERAAYEGMMIHQDGSTHEWVPGVKWDLIVTMDDATSHHYSMFFVDEEGTASSFRGVGDVIRKRGLPACIYTDRGSHYWFTPSAGGKVDKSRPTQFGRAMSHLGIEMIAAYSPEARGRSERAFRTHQGRLVKELALAGITDMRGANKYLEEVYIPAFNEEFSVSALEPESMFVEVVGVDIDNILCEQYDRTVGNDNCVRFEGLTLQIPADKYRCHYVRVTVKVHRYPDGRLTVFHGPRKLAEFDGKGKSADKKKAAA